MAPRDLINTKIAYLVRLFGITIFEDRIVPKSLPTSKSRFGEIRRERVGNLAPIKKVIGGVSELVM